ncbi:hypothetical protein EVG20_g1802 [Dentipellis fragilis]|uniref:MYND-type domain-containing protein n=1 Tax=Dentipellis fragilis TaxID=205917 RepID=A0A4Y9ZBL4_9AGAM|nr:hypothetical protein EVG20_g1802 [Dentipellis fragilis]
MQVDPESMRKCARCSILPKDSTPFSRCSRCKSVAYCSKECQLAHWKTHKATCDEPAPVVPPAGPNEPVRGIVVACEGDRMQRSIFTPVQIPPSHDIYQLGSISPVSVLIGMPIIVWRHLRQSPFDIERSAALDNQIITYIMIEPDNGFAAPIWQENVGTVTVMRQDRKPLSPEAIETIWMYFDNLLEIFGDGIHPTRQMTPEARLLENVFADICIPYPDIIMQSTTLLLPTTNIMATSLEHSTTIPVTGADEPVQGVVVACDGERAHYGIFSPVQLPPSHEIHQQGIISPISALTGVPIAVWRHLEQSPSRIQPSPALDNQITTYLMIDPDSGFAPPPWQGNIGTVTVMRQDRKPLTPEAIETIWMFCDSLLDDFSGGLQPQQRMNPAGFEEFSQNYKESMIMNGRSDFESLTLPL